MIKIKTKKHYFLLISTFLFIYVFFNLLDGERGLISYFEKRETYQNLTIEKKNLENQIKETENKIALLIDLTVESSYLYDKSKNIDLDYIEILIRDSFFYGKPGEKVYLFNNNEN